MNIDYSSLAGISLSAEKRAAITESMREVVTGTFGFPFTTVPLEEIFLTEDNNTSGVSWVKYHLSTIMTIVLHQFEGFVTITGINM